ncbi:NAD-dependent succinate-semialdehyde dehydrogenase [Roseibium sp. RKSG952]|uniref:NAD-dependent succinate-semialdehyde dehydrogenase n=1 Tax=Roseibium sp. RKSG952 TaxID=2529384 RepID=UPI0012BCDBC3|nr:NAD-dependent succinate-semialdehyde dehydrogenase [Roseibium sp. RKSG952]MTH95950.1 NAD-dependent succinate-semialdehyde dehydrogenase [Roseibium sp. RKSG952]
MAITSINPATGVLLKSFEAWTDEETGSALSQAHAAQQQWKETALSERSAILHHAARLLEEERIALARLMTTEMGKPFAQAVAEVEKCARVCRYYADEGPAFLADERILPNGNGSIRYLPLGTILAVMPWNYPLWQVFRCLAPVLMAGNALLLKHASNVPQSGQAIEDVMRRAGLPEGLFRHLLVGSSKVSGIIRDDRVAAVSLTGSEGAGISVAVAAGSVLKKCVLELGGNDPFIVLPSADLDAAVSTAIKARTSNNGQSCVSAKRFIVHEAVYDAFAEMFVSGMKSLTIGDPLLDTTDIGPLATKEGLVTLTRQVRESVAAGAKLLTGGQRVDGPGNFFDATVLADVPEDAPAYREELFGPVAVLLKANSLDHAITLANDTPFGLGSSVWTHDPQEMKACADGIEAGQTFINAMVVSDPRLPFGGIKRSGYGRELGALGARAFTNAKTIVSHD